MAFSDPDSLERGANLRVEDMDPSQLAEYISFRLLDLLQLRIVVGGMEQRTMRQLQETYGPEDAGKIVKWCFWKHKGIWDGETVLPQSFSRGRKWWTDKMFAEVQLQHAKDKRKAEGSVTARFATEL